MLNQLILVSSFNHIKEMHIKYPKKLNGKEYSEFSNFNVLEKN